jgi:hypothetical protein
MNSKSRSTAISQSLLVSALSFVFSLVFLLNYNSSYPIGNTNKEQYVTLPSVSENPKVLLNTTSLSNCLSFYYLEDDNSTQSMVFKNEYLRSNQTTSSNGSDNALCKIVNISDINSCIKYYTNQSSITCNLRNSGSTDLDFANFNDLGLLIVDTKFNNSYDFELEDPSNPKQIIGVNLDLGKHTQSNIDDLNSPRIEIVRKDNSRIPNMSAAKNQEIIWEGNIKDFFKEPVDQYQNETYIAIQFNTGRHGSDVPEEERGFGVLFDVSSTSDPYLFEYRDDGVYTKYNYDLIKSLAKIDFIFHNLDDKNDPVFMNNLTGTNKVKLKVLTGISDSDNSTTRFVKTFVDVGSGLEIPYWSLYDLSKLKSHDRIIDEDGFLAAINQGSGYTIVRTDNIDTRLSAFHSFVFGF